METIKVKNMSYRNIRPVGFAKMVREYSFEGLKNMALRSKNKLGKNTTAMFIDISGKISGKIKKSHWQVFSNSTKKFNSMQRVVSAMVGIFTQFLLEGKIPGQGILLMEDLGKDPYLVKITLTNLKKKGIEIHHSEV